MLLPLSVLFAPPSTAPLDQILLVDTGVGAKVTFVCDRRTGYTVLPLV
jgi:hypothetical protein